MSCRLDVDGVTVRFGATAALRAVALAIPAAETTLLIGPSGCGKSTLLRVLIGLVRPEAGSVRVGDVALDDASMMRVRRGMGYVIQEGGLFPHLSARGNVTLMARHLGWEPGRIATRLDELASLARFPADALERYPSELSGGQRQRAALMRALMLDPEVLLLDEPLGALDPIIRAELQDELRSIFARLGKTVVMVTHDIGEAALFGGRVVLMREGRIVQQGTLEEMCAAPAEPFVSRFIQAQRRGLALLPEPRA